MYTTSTGILLPLVVAAGAAVGAAAGVAVGAGAASAAGAGAGAFAGAASADLLVVHVA